MKPTERSAHWILLRGLGREGRHWGTFGADLEHALNDGREGRRRSRVDAIDLPGAGAYSEMRSPLSMAEIAEFVREKLTELRRRLRSRGEEPPSEVFIAAVSLGGMVAAEWMKEWPNDLTGCVLINTSFGGFSPIYHRLRPAALAHFARIIRARDSVTREEEILRMVSNRPESHHKIAREWARLSLSRPLRPENFAFQLVAARRFRAPATKPAMPILVLSGGADRLAHPACSAEIARRWRAEHIQHPTAGHDLPLDEPQWCIDQILAWWKKIS